MTRLDRKIVSHLMLFCLSVYLLISYGFLSNPDNESVFQTTKSLVENQSLALDDTEVSRLIIERQFTVREGVDGEHYSWFGVFLAVLWIPFYLAGNAIQSFLDWPYPFNLQEGVVVPLFPRLFVSLFNAFVTSMTCAVVYMTLRLLGNRIGVALLTTLVYGFGTLALEYSRSAFSEPLVAFLLALLLYTLVKFRLSKNVASLWYAGSIVGCAILTKEVYVVLVLAGSVYIWLVSVDLRKSLTAFGTPILITLCVIALMNFIRFGGILESPYGAVADPSYFSFPLWLGTYGLVLSPGKGLLFYSPAVILTALGFACGTRLSRPDTVFIVVVVILVTIIYSKALGWHGSWCWGPRYLVPLLPLLMGPVAGVIERYSRNLILRSFLAVCVFGQVFLLFAYYPTYLSIATQHQKDFNVISLTLQYSPLVAQYKMSASNILNVDYHEKFFEHDKPVNKLEEKRFDFFLLVWFSKLYSNRILILAAAILILMWWSISRLLLYCRTQKPPCPG